MKATSLLAILALGLTTTAIVTAQDADPRQRGPHRPLAVLRAMLLKQFDQDGDRKLSEAERQAAQEQFKTNHPDLFAKLDTNGDGKVCPEEIKAAMPRIRDRAMEKFDQDGDGQLNDQERQAAREVLRQRLGR